MSKIQEIKEYAKKVADEKLKSQRKELSAKYKKDEAILEKIIEYVNSGLVYKEVGDTWNKKYIVVTEAILFDDFTGEPRSSYDSKTMIGVEDDVRRRMVVKVNGYSYYHLGDLFSRHLGNLNKAVERTSSELEILTRKRESVKNLADHEAAIKKILLDYDINLEKQALL